MKLIVGLGNPGKEYEKSRHNVGFMIVDELQKNLKFDNFHKETKFDAEMSIGILKEEKIILAKPLTFMNLSGESIMKIVQFYKIPVEEVLVVYDDLDLKLGEIRIRKKGGPGTHNGMKSIVETLGSEDFPRLRVGIESRGVSSPLQQETTSFVLSSFVKEEESIIKKTAEKALNALKIALTEGLEKAMNSFNAENA